MFSLESHLSKFYNKFPEGKHQPIIGITTNYSEGGAALSEKYYSQVVEAGGTLVSVDEGRLKLPIKTTKEGKLYG